VVGHARSAADYANGVVNRREGRKPGTRFAGNRTDPLPRERSAWLERD